MSSLGGLALASVLAVASLVTGCSGIRVVQKTPHGGTVALQGLSDDAREKADDYMRGQCPRGYDVVTEGEAVVGSVTETRSSTGGVRLGAPVVATSAETADKREWRITYQCNGSAEAMGRQVVVVF